MSKHGWSKSVGTSKGVRSSATGKSISVGSKLGRFEVKTSLDFSDYGVAV
jgi:hypothetical protein